MVDVAGQNVVAVLTRAPSAGGKSRLFAALGRPPDPELLRALLLDTLEAAAPVPARRVVCYTPPDAGDEMRALVPPDVGLLAQRAGDLGARMRGAFDDLLGAGARAVAVIGSDLPLLDAAEVGEALRALEAHPDAVILGPARDGGYYLIAAARTPAVLLDGPVWSTPTVLAETERLAMAHGIRICRVAPADDLDTLADLRRLDGVSPGVASRTRAWLVRHG